MDEPIVSSGHVDPRTVPPQMRRRVDASGLLSTSLALPGVFSSLGLMTLLGTAVLPRASWVVPVLWLVSGGVVFIPSIERTLCCVLFHMRQPTATESRSLGYPWHAVCQAAGVDGSRYTLLVQDSDNINAFSAGSRTVAVTRSALQLPPNLLEAVLAHELGHHLSNHTILSMLAWWYVLPTRAAASLVGLVVRFVLFVGRIFAMFGSGVGLLVSLLIALSLLAMSAFFSFWLLLIPITAPLLAWATRLGEFRADRTAARLGYAPALIEVLRVWIAMDGPAHPTGFRTRMLATHPSHANRIGRLQQYR